MNDVIDLFGGVHTPPPTPVTEPVDLVPFTDLDRLRLGLNGAPFDELVTQIRTCERCSWSWPLLCEPHADHVLNVDDYEEH